MKILKSGILIFVLITILGFSVTARSQMVRIQVDAGRVGVRIPSGYRIITAEHIDRPANYFRLFPIDKNDVVERVTQRGVVLNAFSVRDDSEIRLIVSQNEFSREVGNLTPMDETGQETVMNRLQAGLGEEGHAFLSYPAIVRIDGYDFISFTSRIGSGERGYSYRSVFTIIRGSYYQLTYYSTMSVPDEDVLAAFDSVINSLELRIEGEQGQIFSNLAGTVGIIAVIAAAGALALFTIFSLIRHFIVYRNRGEKIRLKKR